MTPDVHSVAFLPNPEESLMPKHHPNEQLSDKKFNKKYQEMVIKAYELAPEESSSLEEEEDNDENESIDLEAPSVCEGNEESEGLYEPGEYAYEDDEFSPEEG
ncbi:hypothetical protein O181_066238 [Austropuccinia psidii MF-1]|uniref:Uncharacterized protein n=1 Tax=Austropuccinia psidii MF-1 TaxID=1389203 RepID=A0A9Q3I3E3_9BASI|nr:hypothetical protein [Austropuccinia psidii MF-1]